MATNVTRSRCWVAICGRAAGGTCRRAVKHLGKCQPRKQLVPRQLPCSGAATLWFWRPRATRGAQRPSAAKSGSSLFQPHLTSVRMAATYEKSTEHMTSSDHAAVLARLRVVYVWVATELSFTWTAFPRTVVYDKLLSDLSHNIW